MLEEIVILALGNMMIVSAIALAFRCAFRRIHTFWIALAASVLTTTITYAVALALINWRDKPFLDKLHASLFESPAALGLTGSIIVGFVGALLTFRILKNCQMGREPNSEMRK